MNISTNLLRTFLAVCEHRNFSLAAAALRKSQSNVSTQVAQLEEEIGLKLFHRHKRPFQLTEAGATFLQFSREVLNRTRDVDRRMQEPERVQLGRLELEQQIPLPLIFCRKLSLFFFVTIQGSIFT